MKLNFIVGNHRNFTYPYSSTENWFAASKLPLFFEVIQKLKISPDSKSAVSIWSNFFLKTVLSLVTKKILLRQNFRQKLQSKLQLPLHINPLNSLWNIRLRPFSPWLPHVWLSQTDDCWRSGHLVDHRHHPTNLWPLISQRRLQLEPRVLNKYV